MLKTSNEIYAAVEVGHTVRVRISEVDRSRGDLQNILAVVIEIEGGFCKLGTKHGVLNRCFLRSQFTRCNENLVDIKSVVHVEKSLREIATARSLTRGQGFIRCNCTTKCTTNKCQCREKGFLRNSECHSSLSRCN